MHLRFDSMEGYSTRVGGCGGEVQPSFLPVPADVSFEADHDFMSSKSLMINAKTSVRFLMIASSEEHQSKKRSGIEYSIENRMRVDLRAIIRSCQTPSRKPLLLQVPSPPLKSRLKLQGGSALEIFANFAIIPVDTDPPSLQ